MSHLTDTIARPSSSHLRHRNRRSGRVPFGSGVMPEMRSIVPVSKSALPHADSTSALVCHRADPTVVVMATRKWGRVYGAQLCVGGPLIGNLVQRADDHIGGCGYANDVTPWQSQLVSSTVTANSSAARFFGAWSG